MSGIGFWELIVLFLVGLIVLGPERLPRVANQLGGWPGQARRMTRLRRRQLEDELNFEKDFPVKTPATTKPDFSTPRYVHDKPVEHADNYSPEHDEEGIGTGVNDEVDVADQEPAESNAADDSASEPPVAADAGSPERKSKAKSKSKTKSKIKNKKKSPA